MDCCDQNPSDETNTNSDVDLDSSLENFEKLSLGRSSEEHEAYFDEGFNELAMMDVFDSSCDEFDAGDFLDNTSGLIFEMPYDTEGEGFGSREEREKWFDLYLEQVDDSDGFDVDDFSGRFMIYSGTILPVAAEHWDDDLAKCMNIAVDKAIKMFNKNHATNYEVVKVEKLNWQAASFALLYITFTAKDGDTENTFQALGNDGIPHRNRSPNVSVEFCRLKGDKQKGVWKEDFCFCHIKRREDCCCCEKA